MTSFPTLEQIYERFVGNFITVNRKENKIGMVCCPSVSVKLIADALFIKISNFPHFSMVLLKASSTSSLLRISHTTGRASPPDCSISFAAVYIVPGNLGFGEEVFAATTILAPSLAHLNAIDLPIPLSLNVIYRLLPEIKITLSFKYGILKNNLYKATNVDEN